MRGRRRGPESTAWGAVRWRRSLCCHSTAWAVVEGHDLAVVRGLGSVGQSRHGLWVRDVAWHTTTGAVLIGFFVRFLQDVITVVVIRRIKLTIIIVIIVIVVEVKHNVTLPPASARPDFHAPQHANICGAICRCCGRRHVATRAACTR